MGPGLAETLYFESSHLMLSVPPTGLVDDTPCKAGVIVRSCRYEPDLNLDRVTIDVDLNSVIAKVGMLVNIGDARQSSWRGRCQSHEDEQATLGWDAGMLLLRRCHTGEPEHLHESR